MPTTMQQRKNSEKRPLKVASPRDEYADNDSLAQTSTFQQPMTKQTVVSSEYVTQIQGISPRLGGEKRFSLENKSPMRTKSRSSKKNLQVVQGYVEKEQTFNFSQYRHTESVTEQVDPRNRLRGDFESYRRSDDVRQSRSVSPGVVLSRNHRSSLERNEKKNSLDEKSIVSR